MSWCKLHSTYRNDPKFIRLADGLGLTPHLGKKHGAALARGLVASLWSWASDHAPDGDLSDLEITEIEDAADWDGAPGAFVAACASKRIGLLDKSRYGYSIHGFLERAESHKAAQRKRKQRETERAELEKKPAPVGTPASQDSRETESMSRDSHTQGACDSHEKVTGERESERDIRERMAPLGAVGEDVLTGKPVRQDRFGEHLGVGMWQTHERKVGLPGLKLNDREQGMLGTSMAAAREAKVDFDALLTEWFRPEWQAAYGWSVEQFTKRVRSVINAMSVPSLRPKLAAVGDAKQPTVPMAERMAAERKQAAEQLRLAEASGEASP